MRTPPPVSSGRSRDRSNRSFVHAWVPLRLLAVLFAAISFGVSGISDAGAGESRAGAGATRVPWTQSRIIGSPEPPLPLVLERVYPQLEFDKPVSIHPLPGSQR